MKRYNPSELIYNYLSGDDKAGVSVSKLPPVVKRRLVNESVQTIAGGIKRNLDATKGTILDQEAYGENISPHETAVSTPEELHKLIINDIVFDILPTQIGVQYQTHSFKSNTIRSQGPVKVKTGRGVISIQLQLVFVGLDDINNKLRRLIAQARVFPIWFIDNEYIRSNVYPESKNKNMAVVLNAMNISTHPEAIDTIVASLSMEVFNWEVYSRNFFFISEGNFNSNNAFSNLSGKKATSSPLYSPLFTTYWDAILGNNKEIKIGIGDSNSKVIQETFSFQLYKTENSFKFPMIQSIDFRKGNNTSIIYDSYKIIPEEVVNQLVQYTPDQNKTKVDQIGEITNTKKELGIYQISNYQIGVDNPIDGRKFSQALYSYKDILTKAKQFAGKPYSQNTDRNRVDSFDCSSLVYNTLKSFNIFLGTFTGSQRFNLANNSEVLQAGSMDQILSGSNNPEKLKGSILFCFRDISSYNVKKINELKSESRIFQNPDGVERHVGHVAFVEDVTKNRDGSYSIKLFHAYEPRVGTTGKNAVRRYNYFEAYQIPNIRYGEDVKGIIDINNSEVRKLIKTVNKDINKDIKNKLPVIHKKEAAIALYDASLSFGKKLVKGLNQWLSKQKKWKLVWLRNGTFLLEKSNVFVIDDEKQYLSSEQNNLGRKSFGPVVQHIGISINNTFARIPMVGHDLVTHQYIGGGDCNVVIHIASIGSQFISELQMIRKYTENAARVFRYLDDVGTLKIINPLIQLSGSEKFIIDSIETKTNQDSPELYDVVISLSEMRNNPRESEEIKQEYTQTQNIRNKFLEKLVEGKLDSDSSKSNFIILLQQQMYNVASGAQFDKYQVSSDQRPLYQDTNNFNSTTINARDLKKLISEYQFSTKEELLRTLIHGVLNNLIGYALPSLQILGITENDLRIWSKDPKHPLYSFGVFNKIEITSKDYNYSRSSGGEKDLLKLKKDKISYAYNNRNYDLLRYVTNIDKSTSLFNSFQNYNTTIFDTYMNENTKIFGKLVQQRQFLLEIPYGGSTFVTKSIDTYTDLMSSLSNISTRFLGAFINFFENLENFLDANQLEIFKSVKGSKYEEARRIFSSTKGYTYDSGQVLELNVTNKITGTLPGINKARIETIKAQMILVGLFSQFRQALYRLSDIGINSLKYSEKYGELLFNVSGEDMALHGLPAYQDIPCPVLNLSDPKYASLRSGLRELDMPNSFYLNPDFYFFNEADTEELNTKRIAEALGSASRLLRANYILAQGFGILPQKDGSKNPLWGPFAARGGDANSKFTNNNTIEGKTKEALQANNLPDMMQLYFPTIMGRTIEKGLATKVGDKGYRPLGMNERLLKDSSAPLNPELIDNAKSGDKWKFNPLVPSLQSVSFGPIGGIESRLAVQLDRNPQNSIKFYESDFIARNSNPYKMRRALPAVKLYFIEDDTSGFAGRDQSSYIKSFDDFFSYRALKEIKLIKSRKFPAAHLIVRVSNLYGNLDSVQFSSGGTVDYQRLDKTSESTVEALNFEKNNTNLENPFTRFMLKEGVRVQLKGGNENNPNLMKTVFNGQIIQINQMAGDEIVIVCQDFGTQLIADIKGQTKGALGYQWIDTFDLLSYLICQPEMTYFGRWSLDSARSVGESRSKGGWEKVFKFLTDPRDDNLFAPSREHIISRFSDTTGGLFSYIGFKLINMLNPANSELNLDGAKATAQRIDRVAGRDIYKVDVVSLSKSNKMMISSTPSNKIADATGKSRVSVSPNLAINGVLAYEYARGDAGYKGLDYHIYRSTIWDIFKEMELRHPGWIGHPVVYGNRMTMFFGQPTQPYWFRPPTPFESREIYNVNKAIKVKLDSSKIYQSLQKAIESKKKSIGYQASVVGSVVKEYAWSAFDWITTGLAIYSAFQTGGAALGVQWVGKQIAKNALRGVALSLLTYGVTSYGSNGGSWTDVIGSIGVGLTGALAAGTGSITKTVAAATTKNLTGKLLVGGAIAAGLAGTIGSIVSQSNISSMMFMHNELRNRLSQSVIKKKLSGRLKQFRNYHIVNTRNHIIANEIKSTVNNTYNAVTLEYTEDYRKDLDANALNTANRATRTVKASHRILDKDLKMSFESFPNCRGLWMADRYAQGLLMRHMKDAYQGQLLLIGDWEYEPYDRFLVEDDFLGMYGQIEAEQVITTFSGDVGFVSEVTPDMVVYGNQIVDMMFDNYMSGALAWYDMSWSEAINAVLKNDPSAYFAKMGVTRQVDGALAGTGVATSSNPNGLSEVEARLLNSTPTLLGLFSIAVGGLALGGAASASAVTLESSIAATNTYIGAAVGSSIAGLTGGLNGIFFDKPILNQTVKPNASNIDRSGISASSTLNYLKFKLFGSMAMKFYEWSTSRQPLVFEPLFLNGKPMLPSIDMDKVSMVQNIKDNFIPMTGNLARGFEVLKEAGRQFVFGELADKINNLPD